MLFQVSEASAEGDVLFRRDFLVSEEEDAVIQKGVVDLLERLIGHRLGEVNPLNFPPSFVDNDLMITCGNRLAFRCKI